MGMEVYEDLKDMLCKELEELTARGEVTSSMLGTAHTLTDTIKNIDKILMYEDDGVSQSGGDWRAEGSYNRSRNAYGRGNSYARRGSHYVRGHYSMTDGKDYLVSQMGEMMNDNSISAQSRNALRRAMETLQNE